MARPRHLKRAPIQEAVIDIRFEPSTTLDRVAGLAVDLSAGSGVVRDVWDAVLELKAEGPGEPQGKQTATLVGKRVDLADRRHVCQLRTNGFTFSRLAPYEDWDRISAAAANAWRPYLAAANAQVITRLAVRYVNVLELPLPISDFGDFLTSPPIVPDELPQSIGSSMNRTLIINADTGDAAMVTQVIEGVSASGKAMRMVFDIDVMHDCQFAATDFGRIESVLSRLRAVKNDVFFSYLKDKTLEPYE